MNLRTNKMIDRSFSRVIFNFYLCWNFYKIIVRWWIGFVERNLRRFAKTFVKKLTKNCNLIPIIVSSDSTLAGNGASILPCRFIFTIVEYLNWICLANWWNRYEHLTFSSRSRSIREAERHTGNRCIRLMNNFTYV